MVKNPPANAGVVGLIPALGRYPGEGHGNPLQYSCLGNPRQRSLAGYTVHGVKQELGTTKQLNSTSTLGEGSWKVTVCVRKRKEVVFW